MTAMVTSMTIDLPRFTIVFIFKGKTTQRHLSRLMKAVIQAVVVQKISLKPPPVGITSCFAKKGMSELTKAGMKHIAFHVSAVMHRLSEIHRTK